MPAKPTLLYLLYCVGTLVTRYSTSYRDVLPKLLNWGLNNTPPSSPVNLLSPSFIGSASCNLRDRHFCSPLLLPNPLPKTEQNLARDISPLILACLHVFLANAPNWSSPNDLPSVAVHWQTGLMLCNIGVLITPSENDGMVGQ